LHEAHPVVGRLDLQIDLTPHRKVTPSAGQLFK
jgi:hypothetical protein